MANVRGTRIVWAAHGDAVSYASTPVSDEGSVYYFGCASFSANVTSGASVALGGVFASAEVQGVCRASVAAAAPMTPTSSAAVNAAGALFTGTPYGPYFIANFGGHARSNGTLVTTDGVVSSSPVIDSSGAVFFTTSIGTVYSLASDGAIRWVAYYAAGYGSVSTPALDPTGGQLYIASYYSAISALNSSTGEFLWSFFFSPSSASLLSFRSSPAIADDGHALYIVAKSNVLIAVNLTAANAIPRGMSVTSSSYSNAELVLWAYDMGYPGVDVEAPFESSPVSALTVNRALLSQPTTHPAPGHHARGLRHRRRSQRRRFRLQRDWQPPVAVRDGCAFRVVSRALRRRRRRRPRR